MTTTKNSPLILLEWDKAQELLDKAQTIVTLTHVMPDGDAIGSVMGLTLALREQGKTVIPAVDGGCPEDFHFIPFSEDIRDNLDRVKPDLIISTDASDKARVGKVGESILGNGIPYIQLDHHQTNVIFGDANLVDARTVAASEGVLDWLIQLGWAVSPQVAQCLLTGMITDTLCFRTANVSAQTFSKAQILMEAGADLPLIVQNTLARMPISLLRLYGQVLPKIKLERGVIWLSVTKDDYDNAGADFNNYTGLSGYLVQADEAYISAVFKELEPNVVECSFRSVPGFDVSQVAFKLGGGGHVQASGCTVHGKSLTDLETEVIAMLKNEIAVGTPLY